MIVPFPHKPLAEMRRACDVIWAPDLYELDVVAEAVLIVLESPDATSGDVYQAAYLLSTFHPHRSTSMMNL